jgi:hypothetical protein
VACWAAREGALHVWHGATKVVMVATRHEEVQGQGVMAAAMEQSTGSHGEREGDSGWLPPARTSDA